MPHHRYQRVANITLIFGLISFNSFLSALAYPREEHFPISNTSTGLDSANLPTLQDDSKVIQLSSRRTYQNGDVLRTLYGPDYHILKGKKLDANQICESYIVNPLSIEGWHYSGASTFIRQWVEASKRTPGFEEHAKQRGYDFRSKFLNDVVTGHNPPECHIHDPCNRLLCKDIVDSLIVPDPAVAMAVMYTDKHMTDFLTVTHAQLQLFDHAQTEMRFSANEIVKRFTWREDKDIEAHCQHLADAWMVAITTIVSVIGQLAGAAGPIAGPVVQSAGTIASKIPPTIGASLSRGFGAFSRAGSSGQRMAQSIASSANTIGEKASLAAKTAGKIVTTENAYVKAIAWGIAPVAANNIANSAGRRGGFADLLCKNVPRVADGSDEAHLNALLDSIKKEFSGYRNKTEHETVRIKEDQPGGSNGWTMVDYLEAGSFFMNSAAEDFFLDNQEESRVRLTEYLQSLFVISTLKSAGAGVHCIWQRRNYTNDVELIAQGKYHVEKDVLCQIFSWLPFKKNQYKVPHWGHQYLDHEGGSQIYGFDTRKIVEKSWAYYKKKAFEPGWKGDLMNDAYQLMGEDFDKLTPVHLPVCFDPEGFWHLGDLGPDPMGPHKNDEPVILRPSSPPCSCGLSGNDTESFLRASGLYVEPILSVMSSICHEKTLGRLSPEFHHHYSGGQGKRAWDEYETSGHEVRKQSDPWQAYDTHCTMSLILDNYAAESGTKRHELIKGHGRDPQCSVNQRRHEELEREYDLDAIDTSCFMLLEAGFGDAIDRWGPVKNKNLRVLSDEWRDRICMKKPQVRAQKVPAAYLPPALKTDATVSAEELDPPFTIRNIPPAWFLCPLPKPWLNETIPPICINLTASFYQDVRLPQVAQYGFLRNTTRSQLMVTPAEHELVSPPDDMTDEQKKAYDLDKIKSEKNSVQALADMYSGELLAAAKLRVAASNMTTSSRTGVRTSA